MARPAAAAAASTRPAVLDRIRISLIPLKSPTMRVTGQSDKHPGKYTATGFNRALTMRRHQPAGVTLRFIGALLATAPAPQAEAAHTLASADLYRGGKRRP